MTERPQRKFAIVGLTHPFRGGISHYTTLLCEALRKRHDVRFYALSRQYPSLLFPGKTQIDESDRSLAIEHEACIDSINPWTWLQTARKIARFAPDLIVYSWWNPFFAPAFGSIARLARRFTLSRTSKVGSLILLLVFAFTGTATYAQRPPTPVIVDAVVRRNVSNEISVVGKTQLVDVVAC